MRIAFLFLLVPFMAMAQPALQRTALTTNLTAGAFSAGQFPIWNATMGRWSNGVASITNTIHVSIDGNDATGQRGSLVNRFRTHIAALNAAQAGDTMFVWPGDYYVPTNTASLMKNGVNQYWYPRARYLTGAYADFTPVTIFDDLSGAVTSSIMGFAEIRVTNIATLPFYLQDPDSKVYFEFEEFWATNSSIPTISHENGELVIRGRRGYSMGYDFYTALNNNLKVRLDVDFIDAADTVIEAGKPANWGDQVFNVRVAVGRGEGAMTIRDKTVYSIDTLYLNGNSSIYGITNDVGNGVLQNCTIYAVANSGVPAIAPLANSGTFPTSMTLRNCKIYGPTNRPAILLNNGNGSFTLDNCTVVSAPSATNAIWATNAQTAILIGTTLNTNIHANVTVRGDFGILGGLQ